MTIRKGLALAMSALVMSFVLGRSFLFVNESPRKIVPVLVIQTIPKTPSLSSKELACIADNAYYEARGEGLKGIAAVIHVTLNRKDSDKFPKDVCAIVYQKVQGKCQYSWTCEHRKSVAFRSTKEYKEIELLAMTVASVQDRKAIDPTKGSLYYKRADSPSKFFRTKLVPKIAIGSHRFYVEA